MAELRKKLSGNAPGEFYVDSSCIDCDLCRQIAPEVFRESGDASIVRRLDAMGGVRWMFLTHQDDVADHRKFRERFGCERILHADDAGFPVERLVEGRDPVRLADDLVIVPTPGHTAGHQVLLHLDK